MHVRAVEGFRRRVGRQPVERLVQVHDDKVQTVVAAARRHGQMVDRGKRDFVMRGRPNRHCRGTRQQRRWLRAARSGADMAAPARPSARQLRAQSGGIEPVSAPTSLAPATRLGAMSLPEQAGAPSPPGPAPAPAPPAAG